MLRAIFVGLLSIGCAAETYTATATEPVCGWSVVTLVSFDEAAGDCMWSIRTLDDSVSRLRSIHGVSGDPLPLCEVSTYGRIDQLRPTEPVEIWSPADAETAWLAVEQSACD